MKLPLIKNIVEFIEKNDEDYILETIETLEHVAEAKGLKDSEIEVIAELLSNMYGGIDVNKSIRSGIPKKDALNSFMKRVMGSID